ncbi:MAG: UvrD-helicase domain-containing protein, partial [Pseudomonadales bacterium]
MPIEALESQVRKLREHVWRPGKWGKRLGWHSSWSAIVNEATLQIDDTPHPIENIHAVRSSRGIFWTKVIVEHQDGEVTRLGGLTGRSAKSLAKLVHASCVISALSQLKILIERGKHQREKWTILAAKRRWLAQSEVKRFIAECPANSTESPVARILGRQFTKDAMSLQSEETLMLLEFLDGRNIPALAQARNTRFMQTELVRCARYFDNVEKNPLTDEQRRAAVTIDDNVLTVAAAGSGKTSLLVAKAGYAIDSGQFSPDQILMLAFNRDAADELADRVKKQLKPLVEDADRITVATFHALGLKIIGEATGEQPSVAPWIDKGQEMAELVDISRCLCEDRAFAKKWDLFKTVFATALPEIGSKEEPEAWDPETGRKGFMTYRGEIVKSKEERMIANWLVQAGADYQYERSYEWPDGCRDETYYQPDFYYPSANVYHEHFALDAKGNAPDWFEPGYVDGVHWKRDLHTRLGTKLLETTSHGIRQTSGFARLEAGLKAAGVRFGETFLTDEQRMAISDDLSLLRVFRTFMTHVKSNRLSMNELRERAASRESNHRLRDEVFLDIFEVLWAEWERRLAAGNYVDFEDMLCKASDYLARGVCSLPYRLILADEFQDSSRARGALLKNLSSAEDARLFVVGDDWQAVNRFAGADISLMRDFGKHFGDNVVQQLTRTFRCPNDICQIAGSFIMANPYQIKKSITSARSREAPGVICFHLNDINGQDSLLRSHLGKLAEKLRSERLSEPRSAYVLGRYRHDQPICLAEVREQIADVVELRWSTIHAAKGLEADYIFLMNVVEATYGFPSQIADDSSLWIAMPDGEDFPFAEERRLFYVALTRAKQLVTIYTDANRRSEFVAELVRQDNGMEVRFESGYAEER